MRGGLGGVGDSGSEIGKHGVYPGSRPRGGGSLRPAISHYDHDRLVTWWPPVADVVSLYSGAPTWLYIDRQVGFTRAVVNYVLGLAGPSP